MEVTVGSWDGMTKFEIDNEFPRMLDGSNECWTGPTLLIGISNLQTGRASMPPVLEQRTGS